MAIGEKGSSFKTKKMGYLAGYGLVMNLDHDLPRKYDEKTMGSGEEKGFTVTGMVISVLGANGASNVPEINSSITVTIRPSDSRKSIYDDLNKTNEGTRFLLEGITGDVDKLEARWAHGAGSNRHIAAVEIASVPHVSFENPFDDGPSNGYLRLNLDGSPFKYDERQADGSWVNDVEMPFDAVVDRLKLSLEQERNFRVVQRVLEPSKAVLVSGQDELESTLYGFRQKGLTSCIVRTFIPGTTDPKQVDTQVMDWPENIPATGSLEEKVYDMPMLKETKKFVSLRDGEAIALMEVIPGYTINLVGNPNDPAKSVKHKFVNDIVNKGMTNGQKNLYATQSYGPGIAIRAVNEDSVILGLTRLITRTDGPQYRNLMSIPTPAFPDANKLDFSAKSKAGGESTRPAEEASTVS